MDVGVPRAGDNRRLEVVVDGLLLFNGRQLAVDTTLVSTLKGNGEPRRGAADRDGWHSQKLDGSRNEPTPNSLDLTPGHNSWSLPLRWVAGGRRKAKIFIRLLARARFMQRRLEQAWRPRLYAIITCAAARAFAASLLGLRGGRGSDGQVPPSHEVERDHAIALRDCLSPKKKTHLQTPTPTHCAPTHQHPHR